MNIKRAKQEIKNTIRAYQLKNADGTYRIPSIRQRPVLLMGPPGVGKTQIMGGDFDLKIDVTPQLYSYFNLTYQDIRDKLKWTTNDQSVKNPT